MAEFLPLLMESGEGAQMSQMLMAGGGGGGPQKGGMQMDPETMKSGSHMVLIIWMVGIFLFIGILIAFALICGHSYQDYGKSSGDLTSCNCGESGGSTDCGQCS